jgi:hypothetical protein
MAPDLEHLLHETATPPRRTVDTDHLLSRVRRRRRARRAAGAAASLGAAAVVVLLVIPLVRPPLVELVPVAGPGSDASGAGDPSPAPPASQGVDEAARDGVVPAIAALPFEERVQVLERVPAPEGVWVRSELSEVVLERAREDVCAIGAFDDPRALDGRDAVCADDYGEVLLLDPTGQRIVRAYPLPYVPAQTLVLGEDAVYCARQGGGGLPDSMLCRIDRVSGEAVVRVLPFAKDSIFSGDTNLWTPSWWTVEEPGEVPQVLDALEVTEDALLLRGTDGTRRADPRTLELLEG